MKTLTEEEARSSFVCCGCQRPKDSGNGLVCWSCFKYGPNPLKYYDGTFAAWQLAMRIWYAGNKDGGAL